MIPGGGAQGVSVKDFFANVLRAVFDVRPVAVVAAIVQFALIWGLLKIVESGCGAIPGGACRPELFDLASSAFPGIVLWIVIVALVAIIAALGWGLWMSVLPLGLIFGLAGAALLPTPLNMVGAVVVILVLLGFAYRLYLKWPAGPGPRPPPTGGGAGFRPDI